VLASLQHPIESNLRMQKYTTPQEFLDDV
jgi:hypothetical protein